MKYLLAISLMMILLGCSESATTEEPSDEPTEYTESSYDDSVPTAEEAPTYSGEEFHGKPCLIDCSGHEAGYQWAEENGINDPDSCGGDSSSFIEGCQSYAEEQQ